MPTPDPARFSLYPDRQRDPAARTTAQTASATITVTIEPRPTPRSIRRALAAALHLPDSAMQRAAEADRLICSTLAQQPRVLVCNQAQLLRAEAAEYLNYLAEVLGPRVEVVLDTGGAATDVVHDQRGGY